MKRSALALAAVILSLAAPDAPWAAPAVTPAPAPVTPPPEDPLINAFLASINRDPPDDSTSAAQRARAVCARTLAENIDLDALLARARIRGLGGVTDTQRTAFRTAAGRWLVRKCVERSRERERLEFLGLRPGENGDQLLATRASKSRRVIVWRLRGGQTLVASDLIVDGSSTALRLRDEVASLLRAGGGDVGAMIARLGREAR